MKRTLLRIAVLLCCLSIACAGLPEAGRADDAGTLREPVVEADASLSTGQRTLWTCVTFGAYPQTEIVPAPSAAVDAYAVQPGDFLEDPALYARLCRAEWAENETEIDGVRYRRLGRAESACAGTDQAGRYRWGEEDYHYFRYDPVRWRVLALEGEKALLLADRLLDCMPFHAASGPVTWETSTLRSWLNGYGPEENAAHADYRGAGFPDMAFTPSERAAILPSPVENAPNASYQTDCGPDTEDRVFLLSNAEVFASPAAARYGFYQGDGKDDPAKRFRSTLYAKCRGAWWSPVNGYRGNSFWFMRTNGYNPESVTYICDFGYIYQRGTVCTCGDAGILPALWVDLTRAACRPAGTVSSGDVLKNASGPAAIREKDRVANPAVTARADAPDGKEVTYSLIRFGSYPQAEVLPEQTASSAGAIADPALYQALEEAVWENGECALGGRRYCRVRAAGGGGQAAWRYFAYEPLLWRVLEVRDGAALLLSHAAVDCEPFQEDLRDVSWENCTLRSYLNGYGPKANASGRDWTGSGFLPRAFTADEQAAILPYPVRNESNHYFGTGSGRETADRIFLPAESELFIHDSAEIHGFSRRDDTADRARQFRPTDYALMKGAWRAGGESGAGNVFWITRTTGYTHANVVYVDESGYLYNRGILVTCADAALLPALVLDLDASAWEYAGTWTVGAQEDTDAAEDLPDAA